MDEAPFILRARGFRLYAANGKRYTDLYQAGGKAILGHTPPSSLREFKNAAERGLFAPFPHPLQSRFKKALAQLLPGYEFYVYESDLKLRAALKDRPLIDPAFLNTAVPPAEIGASLWRPFLDATCQSAAPLLVPVLPHPLAPKVLAIQIVAAPNSAPLAYTPPPSDTVSPAVLAVAARAVYDLIAEMRSVKTGRGAANFPAARFPRIAKALKTSRWLGNGAYLIRPDCKPLADNKPCTESYTALKARFLESGFILPPDPSEPAILPAELSDGEEAKLAAALGE